MKKSVVGLLCGILMAALLLAGCNSGGGASSAAPSSAPENALELQVSSIRRNANNDIVLNLTKGEEDSGATFVLVAGGDQWFTNTQNDVLDADASKWNLGVTGDGKTTAILAEGSSILWRFSVDGTAYETQLGKGATLRVQEDPGNGSLLLLPDESWAVSGASGTS